MAEIKLYGISGSRALRSLWAIEEVGVDYEHVSVDFREQSKSESYLAINPNGRIPALQDGDTVVVESMAINLYLAKNYGGALYPSDPADEAHTWQWSVWGISEIEPLQMDIVVQRFFMPEDKRDDRVVARAEKGLARPLKVLDAHLADREWLVGSAFSIADLNLSAVMLLLEMVGFDHSAFPNVERWLATTRSRPSLERARKVGA